MAIRVDEKFESRHGTTGPNPTIELRYTIRGTESDVEARIALESTAPLLYDVYGNGLWLLPRDTATVEPVGTDLWDGIVRYGVVPAENESTFAFDTGGGTQHITQSLHTVGAYAASGTPPNFHGAIGVTANGVEGVDIVVPVHNFSETHYLPDACVTAAYKILLSELTGSVNDAIWRGFPTGTVLFLGAAGAKRGFGPWEITYRFAAGKNVTNKQVGDITGIAKKAWEYLWVRYADAEDTSAKALVKKPIAVYVERTYELVDFGLLGIGVD